jgi:uncharacterized membrane protein
MNARKESQAVATAPDEDRLGRMSLVIGNLLRVGVGGSLALVLFGMAITFARHPSYATSAAELPRLTHPAAASASLSAVARGAIRMEGRAWVLVGLLLLIATPTARVAASIVLYALQRDWTYVIITALVLALLFLSFMMGWAA